MSTNGCCTEIYYNNSYEVPCSVPNNKGMLYSWMAGFVDGEGTITICTVAKNKQYVIKLAVSNTNRSSLEAFEREFGGRVRTRNWGNKKGKENWKTCYEWSLTAKKAVVAIMTLQPYLKLKHKQARVCVRFHFVKSSRAPVFRRWNKEYSKRLDEFSVHAKSICARLNKRGVNNDANN